MGIKSTGQELDTFIIDLNTTEDMFWTNYAMEDNLLQQVNGYDMELALGNVGSVLSIATLFGWAVSSIATVAQLMANAINDLSTSEAESHRSIIYGGVRTMKELIGIFTTYNYEAMEVELAFLEYEMTGGETHRYVYGNEFGDETDTYTIKRIKVDGVWYTDWLA